MIVMGLIQVRIADEVEMALRRRALKKGDLGRLVETALKEYFKRNPSE